MDAYKGEGKDMNMAPTMDFWGKTKSERKDIKELYQILIPKIKIM
jgi:hypothetical protein